MIGPWLTTAALAAPLCGTQAPTITDAAGMAPLLRAPRAVALVDAPWSSWSTSSAETLRGALPLLEEVPAWCLAPVAERQALWPWSDGEYGIVDKETGAHCVYYAKGNSSPLLLLSSGVVVGCVQRPWSVSPAELAAAIRAGFAAQPHPALSEAP